MEKKICELKLNELQAVSGGIDYTASLAVSAYKVPTSTTWSQPVNQPPVARPF